MKVFYTASFYGKRTYQYFYDLVLDAIEKQADFVVSPEKGNYREVLSEKERKTLDTNEMHYRAIKRGIQTCDVVVLEISHQDFQIGFEAAYAVENKKYVLALSLHEDFGLKIRHPFFKSARYNEMTIDNIVEDFLKFAQKNQYSERFNFFLSHQQLRFLQKQAEQVGLNQSEYMRYLLDEKRKKGE